MQTFRKLPMAAPKRNVKDAINEKGRLSSMGKYTAFMSMYTLPISYPTGCDMYSFSLSADCCLAKNRRGRR
jgi:hypothetical protein